MIVSKQNRDACSLVCKDWTGRRRVNQSREWCDRCVSIANGMVTRISLGHAEGNVTKCRDKTSHVIELETIHVSRRQFRDILRHCPAKQIGHAIMVLRGRFATNIVIPRLTGFELWSHICDQSNSELPCELSSFHVLEN